MRYSIRLIMVPADSLGQKGVKTAGNFELIQLDCEEKDAVEVAMLHAQEAQIAIRKLHPGVE